MTSHKRLFALLAAALSVASALAESQPGVNPGPGKRYATDAYPGFDNIDEAFKPEKKTPRWFSWFTGPKKDNATDQFAWCQQCEKEESWRAARKGYDALVREWPTSPEAPKAQQRLAEIWLEHYLDYEEAFAEFRYLLDFYSLECAFDAIALKMYQTAELMRQEGKTIMFFRFKNTADVRRAYESLVLRTAGAPFVCKAMLTIAQLREDEQQYEKAVAVYENLRNLYPGTEEAKTALHDEASVRMKILDEHGYNRARTVDTIDFLKMARREGLTGEAREDLDKWLTDAENLRADEAFQSAKFYDSSTRTLRSAINAYERFIDDYPNSPNVEKARERLMKLKEKDAEQKAKEAEKEAARQAKEAEKAQRELEKEKAKQERETEQQEQNNEKNP